MKKVVSVLLALVLVVGMLTACGNKDNTSNTTVPAEENTTVSNETEPESSEAAKKVVFLVNGNLGDKGFFDSCAEGINRLGSEYGCTVKIVEMGRDETSYETFFRDVSEQDWDLIVAATWSVQELLETVAADYPEKQYLFIDGEVSGTNTVGVSFYSNETSFMAGCLAALQLNSGDEKIDPEKKIVGIVASMDSTNINDFVIGFIEGVNYIDDSIRVLTSYVGAYEDVATCMEMTTQLYNQGAQVVYAPASQSVMGAATASSDVNKYLIGCDTDLYNISAATDENLVRNVLSSSLKRMGDAIVEAAQGMWDGSISVGTNLYMGLKENAVGLADNVNYQALVSEENRTLLNEIAEKVASGEIKVSTAFGMETSEIAALRDSKKPQ